MSGPLAHSGPGCHQRNEAQLDPGPFHATRECVQRSSQSAEGREEYGKARQVGNTPKMAGSEETRTPSDDSTFWWRPHRNRDQIFSDIAAWRPDHKPHTTGKPSEDGIKPISGGSASSESSGNDRKAMQDEGEPMPPFEALLKPHGQKMMRFKLDAQSRTEYQKRWPAVYWRGQINYGHPPEGLLVEIRNAQFSLLLEESIRETDTRVLIWRTFPARAFRAVFDKIFRTAFPSEHFPSSLHIQIEPADDIPGLECKRHGPVKQRGVVTVTQHGTSGQLQVGPGGVRVHLNPNWNSSNETPMDETYAISSKNNSQRTAEWKWICKPPPRHPLIEPGMVVGLENLWSIWEIPSECQAMQKVRFKMTLWSMLKGSGFKLFKRASCRLEGPPQYFDVSF